MWIQRRQLERSYRPKLVRGVCTTKFVTLLRHRRRFEVAVEANGAANILNIIPYAIQSGIKVLVQSQL